ncbi:MAG: hypothetical protein A4E32_01323 [Methanomassiliicoccales archaeon PtaU1.Bin124]|nr:MAG: hypothetical protein A4E32_01323 [Methanomassiliicoccales archaeon PtaU1.Bin124]
MAEDKLEPMFLSKEEIDLFAEEMRFKGMDAHLHRLAQKLAANTVSNYVFRDQRRYDLCEEVLRFNHRLLFPGLTDKDIEHSLTLYMEYQSLIDTLLDLAMMTGPQAINQLENDPRWESARKIAIQYGLAIGMKTNDAMNYALAAVEAGKGIMGRARYAEKRQLLVMEEIFLRTLLGGMEGEWLKRQSNLAVRALEDYRVLTRSSIIKALDDSAEYHYVLLYCMKYPGARGAPNRRTGVEQPRRASMF